MKLATWATALAALLLTSGARAEGIHEGGLDFEVRGARVCWLEPAGLHVDADCTDADATAKAVRPAVPDLRYYAYGELHALDTGKRLGAVVVLRTAIAEEAPVLTQGFAEKAAEVSRKQSAAFFPPPLVTTVERPSIEHNGETPFIELHTRVDGLSEAVEKRGSRHWVFEVPERRALWVIDMAANKETSDAVEAIAAQSKASISLASIKRPRRTVAEIAGSFLPYAGSAIVLAIVLVTQRRREQRARRTAEARAVAVPTAKNKKRKKKKAPPESDHVP